MVDLSKHTMLSFEISDDCNIKKLHKKCPIHYQHYEKSFGKLTVDKICRSIDEANRLNFHGYIEFHHYNEPLMAKQDMLSIMEQKRKNRYVLITNGLLLSENMADNSFLNQFELVMITCYLPSKRDFYDQIKNTYPHVMMAGGGLDDRLTNYEKPWKEQLPLCKRPYFELPIDHFGNVRLCCFDWKNTVAIGNINETSLTEVVTGKRYQNILSQCLRGGLNYDICHRCTMNDCQHET